MATPLKPPADPETTLGALDIRVGRVLNAVPEPEAPRPAYRLTVDFGPYGVKTSVGRFTGTPTEKLVGTQVLGVLNFAPRQVGAAVSEVLILGVQLPGAASGEAVPLTPASEAKQGSNVF